MEYNRNLNIDPQMEYNTKWNGMEYNRKWNTIEYNTKWNGIQ